MTEHASQAAGEWRIEVDHREAEHHDGGYIHAVYLVHPGKIPGLVHKVLESVLTLAPMQPKDARAFSAYLNDLEAAAPSAEVVEETINLLKHFSRWHHRQEFSHVRPNQREREADVVIEAWLASLSGGK